MYRRFFSQIKNFGNSYSFVWDLKSLTRRLAQPNHEACFDQIKSINNLVLQTNGRPLFILPGHYDFMSQKTVSSLIKSEFPSISHLSEDFHFLEDVTHCLNKNEYTFADEEQKKLFLAYVFKQTGKRLTLEEVNRILFTPVLRKMGYLNPELEWDKLPHNRIDDTQLEDMKDHIIFCADPVHRLFFGHLIEWLAWKVPGKNNVCTIENAELLLAEKYDQVKEKLQQKTSCNTIGGIF